MSKLTEGTQSVVGAVCAAALLLAVVQVRAGAEDVERTNVNILVREAETGQPIQQAHLTLVFREPGRKALKPRLPHHISYSAKTNPQGRCKFADIPKGTVRLVVTAEQHQAFGKDFELERDNQLIEVSLKKPQPLL
jgi:hypothetical protein